MRFAVASSSLFLALAMAACGGHASIPGGGNGDGGGAVLGASCAFDTDCNPPGYVCDLISLTCVEGCGLNPNCPPGRVCNSATGRCILGQPDAGTDAGTNPGQDAGVAGTPSATLCHTCSVNSDCQDNGMCVSNSTHTQNFCTQDCSKDACPAGFTCTLDRTGKQHQCYPETGDCSSVLGTGNDGGVGTDGGPVNNPNVPSDNPNGCGFCGTCNVNNDCVSGSVCVNGGCAVGPCTGWLDCALHGAYLATCTDVGLSEKYCMPALGQCLALPGPLAPLSGDVTCIPSGANPDCSIANLPSTSLGANVSVTANFNPKPLLATEDTIARDSAGRMALGFIGVDSNGNSYMGVTQSTDNGATWHDKGKMAATTPTQSDPVIVVSRWTDSAGTHERMHYVWVGYTLTQNGQGQPTPTNMFMESSYSDDGGNSWSAGITATSVSDNNSGTLLLDKPWIAVSPDASQTLMLTFSIGDTTQQHMYMVSSSDHGLSWGPKTQIETGENSFGHNLGMPVFDPADTTGNTVYIAFVTYQQVQASTANSVTLMKSTDKGLHWAGPWSVSAAGEQVFFEPPSIAMDKNHHVYVGYVASPASAGAAGAKYWDANVASIDASGGVPVVSNRARVSDDQGGCFQHIHVMTQVDLASGKVFAGFLDNRDGGKGSTWYTTSADGVNWAPNKRISDSTYTFNPDHQSAQLNFLGDYFGFFWDGSTLRVAWSDPRDGTSSQVFYAGGAP
jgi:hypothetical protein